MIKENKFSKYLLYAIGEIVLVVIGILIALSINNNNEDKKARKLEVKYLKNLQADVVLELENNDSIITYRELTAIAAARMLDYKKLETGADILTLEHTINQVFMRKNFIPTNNTYKELLNSGNLNYITSDAIKDRLLELDKMYVAIGVAEYHMYREYEAYLYDVSIGNAEMLNLFDIQETAKNGEFVFQDSSKISAEIIVPQYKLLLQKKEFINGLKLSVMNNIALKNEHIKMIDQLKKLNILLLEDIKKDK
jgi:hypothetical protein